MELRDEHSTQSDATLKTAWLLIAIALSAFEMLLPRIPILPWLKPGLANIITILWIIRFGTKDALLFSLLRTWISGFYFGFSFTTLALGLSGGLLATAIMGGIWHIAGKNKIIGTIGLGMIGAFSHNIGQLCAIYLLMARNGFIFYQIPFMCAASLVFGGIIGASTPLFAKILLSETVTLPRTKDIISRKSQPISNTDAFIACMVFALCISLLFIKSLYILSLSLVITIIAVQCICGFSLKKIYYPLRFWALFLFIGIMYLFFSYGTRVHGLPFITNEGIYETTAQFLRLYTWLEIGFLLNFFHFHEFFFKILRIIFPAHLATFKAGLISMEFFPAILQYSRKKSTRADLNFFKNPIKSLHVYLERLLEYINSLLLNGNSDTI